MIPTRLALAVSILLVATVAAASDWSDRVRHAAPGGVVLTEVTESAGSLRVVGHAAANPDVAAFMRALVQADLGKPVLQEVTREDGRSRFVLQIQATP